MAKAVKITQASAMPQARRAARAYAAAEIDVVEGYAGDVPATVSAVDQTDESWSLPRQLYASAIFAAVFIALCCGLYPLVVWGVAQVLFPVQANGSLVTRTGAFTTDPADAVGSALLGQTFTAPQYFHPRPSAAGAGYDAASSGGTNLGPLSSKLLNGIHDATNPDGTPNPAANFDGIKDLVSAYRVENDLAVDAIVPADAVTRSGSGLDPHISPENALLQTPRVARARGLSTDAIRRLIDEHTDSPALGVLGEPGVNVLMLNLALDAGAPH